jgi:hypothetical protein
MLVNYMSCDQVSLHLTQIIKSIRDASENFIRIINEIVSGQYFSFLNLWHGLLW